MEIISPCSTATKFLFLLLSVEHRNYFIVRLTDFYSRVLKRRVLQRLNETPYAHFLWCNSSWLNSNQELNTPIRRLYPRFLYHKIEFTFKTPGAKNSKIINNSWRHAEYRVTLIFFLFLEIACWTWRRSFFASFWASKGKRRWRAPISRLPLRGAERSSSQGHTRLTVKTIAIEI